MREIKFKARYQEKTYLWEIPSERESIVKMLRNPEYYIGVQFFQLTGQKDKDNKEIYEGDILEREIEDSPNEYFIVQILNQRFAYPINKPSDWSDIFNFDKIIGNIYENLELLKKFASAQQSEGDKKC